MFKSKKIVVLETRNMLCKKDIEEMEAELSKKFGCKVILLNPIIGTKIQVLKI